MNSEKLKTLLRDFRISIPVGVIVGLILGLIIGWGIWPVQWTDLAAYHLRPDLREDYLRMSIFTTAMTGDKSIALKAWSELDTTAEETLAAVRNDQRYITDEQITSFLLTVGSEEVEISPEIQPTESEEEQEGGTNWLLLGVICVVMLLVAAALVYFLVIRSRPSREGELEPLQPHEMEGTLNADNAGQPFSDEAVKVSEQPAAQEPVAQFMTTFMFGDDLYDDSFSIDAPTGEFLGECGVGISDTVGVGEPKRVAAFEVWLFDKNDIQTVTKVIMSAHAYEDNKIRMRLESKGEPILAEPGKQILLETASLQLEAKIIDMEYGEGAAPENSFFDRLSLELAVWPK